MPDEKKRVSREKVVHTTSKSLGLLIKIQPKIIVTVLIIKLSHTALLGAFRATFGTK